MILCVCICLQLTHVFAVAMGKININFSTYSHTLSADACLFESSWASELLHILAEVAFATFLSCARLAHLATHSSPSDTTRCSTTCLQFLGRHEAVFFKFLKVSVFTSDCSTLTDNIDMQI